MKNLMNEENGWEHEFSSSAQEGCTDCIRIPENYYFIEKHEKRPRDFVRDYMGELIPER